MSTPEPTALGTIAELSDGCLALLLTAPSEGRNWFRLDDWTWSYWAELDNPVIVHQGYTPPTPEPTGDGAVVRLEHGLILYAVDDPDTGERGWMANDGRTQWKWGSLAQPVEVLFEGVDE